MKGVQGYNRYTLDDLKNEFKAVGVNWQHGISCEDIKLLAMET